MASSRDEYYTLVPRLVLHVDQTAMAIARNSAMLHFAFGPRVYVSTAASLSTRLVGERMKIHGSGLAARLIDA